MFPYPSGNLHLGHVRNYVIADAIARYRRIKGDRVIFPMGWDAFGLPAENAAIASKTFPHTWTKNNIQTMRNSISRLNLSVDWDREIATNDPRYYRWTQWFFIQMIKRGIVYRKEGFVNWDPVDRTVLANEQVDAQGRGWRSGAKVERRLMNSWYIAISRYAPEMIASIEASGQPKSIISAQRNWIENIRDWGISRQRYWGTPIPVIHCPHCGVVPVPEDCLPVIFPEPSQSWEDYPQQIEQWKRECFCPVCRTPAIRETETMDTFVDSAWYFFRYVDPNNETTPFDREKVEQWMPMAYYIGGKEHGTAHLVYARFFSRFIRDLGMSRESEPFKQVIAQGMVLGQTYQNPKTGAYFPKSAVDPDNPFDPVTGDRLKVSVQKMSKSKFNGADPQALIDRYGVDEIRTHILFKAPVDKDVEYDTSDVEGIVRFIRRVRAMEPTGAVNRDREMSKSTVQFWREYCQQMDSQRFNSAIATIMKFSRVINQSPDSRDRDRAIWTTRKALSPFAPSFS